MVELNEKALEVGQRVEKYTGEARWFGTILSTYTTGRGKVRHVVEVEPQGFQMIAVPEQLRPSPALPAPDDGLVEKLLEAADDWRRLSDPENEELTLSAATALQSQAEQIERLTQDRDSLQSALEGVRTNRDGLLEAAEQQVQKLTADKANLHKTGQEYLVASEAVFDWMNGNDLSADHEEQCPRDFARVCKAIVEFRSALETQEGGK